MDIENKVQNKKNFGSLKCGDVFKDGEYIYMKIKKERAIEELANLEINAINLSTNNLGSFSDYEEVLVYKNAKLILAE